MNTTPIRSAAVLGAGTMGAQIAAHLANAGVPVLLLDLTEDAAREGLKRARALTAPPSGTRKGGSSTACATVAIASHASPSTNQRIAAMVASGA